MRRSLVVAHQTLASRELLDAMHARTDAARADGSDVTFHLLVPIHHGEPGLTWTEGHDRAVARRHLDEAMARMTAEGLTVTGEVGSDSPVESVEDVLGRDGPQHYDGIIVSTLPHTVSKWLKIDVPSRIQRATTLNVEHLVAQPREINV